MVGVFLERWWGICNVLKILFILGGESISCKSVKQILIASSTVQAEFLVCYKATTQEV